MTLETIYETVFVSRGLETMNNPSATGVFRQTEVNDLRVTYLRCGDKESIEIRRGKERIRVVHGERGYVLKAAPCDKNVSSEGVLEQKLMYLCGF